MFKEVFLKNRHEDNHECFDKDGYAERHILPDSLIKGFLGVSDGKESTHNARDLGSIPGSGRSPGEGNGYALQYSWASLVSQMVKNLPAMRETSVRSLGWEDPLEEGMATHPSILA